MKYSEELALRLKGVKSEEIKAMKEQEALELEEAAKAKEVEDEEENDNLKNLLSEAQEMIKKLEESEALKVAEIENLNHALAEKNNKATVAEVPPAISPADQATEVMKQLFNKKKED